LQVFRYLCAEILILRTVHYITITVAIAVIALLYWGGNTKPPKKAGDTPAVAGNMAEMPHTIAPASFDSMLEASVKELPEHAVNDLEAIKKEVAAATDSVHMAPHFINMAKLWQEHKKLPVAAYYYALAAKLENSEKSLNFAGQLFLDLVHETNVPGIQIWEAQQAVACFQRSLEINPANDTVKMALAAGFIEGTGETMQGVQLLLGITREKPDNIPANLMLGRLSVQSGQFDKALGRFETVLKQDPVNTEALYFIAEAYKGKGDKQKAIEYLEQCKKVVNKPEFSRDIDQYINSFK
jgi:tetratricopeptide (TPR) repeat protein